MPIFLSLFILVLCAVPAWAGEDTQVDALTLVTRRLCDYQLQLSGYTDKTTEIPPEVANYLAKLDADGAWADIDYNSRQRAVWPTGNHLSRVLAMTLAWQHSVMQGKAPDALLAGIHRALGYWRQHDFQCPNWWYNNIGGPQALIPTGLLLGDQLQPEERAYLTQTVLPRAKIAMTGQNRVWLAGITLMGGVLQRDEALVRQAADVIFSEIVVTQKEGIQPDFSFHQHGPQLQFGNYGLAFATELLKWADILHGSPWALPPEKLEIFRRYLLEGERWTGWRGKMDISSCGRQLAPGSPAAKYVSLNRVLTAMARLDTEHAGEYTVAARSINPKAENTLPGDRYFWRSDYLAHRRPEFAATLKMCSARVIGAESLNSENLSGYYLADGALYLYRTGNEYTDIFPVWNWRRLPGVTCAQEDGPLRKFSNVQEKTSFVGGVSDGVNGCAVFDYQRDGVAAKKAWFFLGDQVVCLGAGITADEKVIAPLATSINQCRLNGPVRACAGATERVLPAGVTHAGDLTWVEHDGVRYLFPQPQQVTVSTGPQTGKWRAVLDTVTTPKEPQTLDVFNLWIEHGAHPEHGSYAYILQPTEAARKSAPVILQNTEQAQAARAGAAQVAAVFHAAGRLDYTPGHAVEVDNPCVLLLNTDPQTASLWVADPTQTLSALRVTVDGKSYTVQLPQGGKKGASVVVKLD